MKTFFKVIGYTAITILISGAILHVSLSAQSSNKEYVQNSAVKAVVTVPAKQSHFFVTQDYQKALKYLNKGYVLQNVSCIIRGGGSEHKFYTMVKYAR